MNCTVRFSFFVSFIYREKTGDWTAGTTGKARLTGKARMTGKPEQFFV
jgi:hypothetical protein